MKSGFESLLALDAYTTEEALRIAAYDRAMTLKTLAESSPPAKEIAESIIDFVQGDYWRMGAVDVALKYADRRTSIKSLIAKAGEIAKWAKPPVEVAAPEPQRADQRTDDERRTQPAAQKKSRRGRGRR